jgi:hypothetical protein
MSRVAVPIKLSEEQRGLLESWIRKETMEQRMVQRARIVLESGAGKEWPTAPYPSLCPIIAGAVAQLALDSSPRFSLPRETRSRQL